MSNRADEYRRFAEECQARAAATKDPDHKRQYLDMSHVWLMLAADAERREPSTQDAGNN
jgi:hypothetical protein